ncbi:MAG: hypothetical protein WAM04_18780 [Candidatus Sulfotelmatobacter sp.]
MLVQLLQQVDVTNVRNKSGRRVQIQTRAGLVGPAAFISKSAPRTERDAAFRNRSGWFGSPARRWLLLLRQFSFQLSRNSWNAGQGILSSCYCLVLTDYFGTEATGDDFSAGQ